MGSLVQDPIHLRLGLQNVFLQLTPSVRRACVLVSATINHGRIKLPSVRVPGEFHFGGGACYMKASPLFPRTHTVVVITQPPHFEVLITQEDC